MLRAAAAVAADRRRRHRARRRSGSAAKSPRGADPPPRRPVAGPLPRARLRGRPGRRHAAEGHRRRAGARRSCRSSTRCRPRTGWPSTWSCRSRPRRPCSGPTAPPPLARMVHVAGPRLIGLHYGTYDYSAALGIAAAHQASDHPAADFAKQLMQVAVAGTGAHAVDGSTNVLPGRRRGSRCTPPGSCTPGWCAGRWNAASTRAGTCTRPSWSPATSPPTPSSGPRCPAAAGAAGRLPRPHRRRRPRRAGHRPGAGRACCCAGWTAARSTRRRSWPRAGPDARRAG